MYDHNDKKYIRLVIPEKCAQIVDRMHINKARLVQHTRVDNPLDGRVLTVKVPFRYRRVMCEVRGQPVQSLIKDDEVEVVVEFKGVWNVGEYSGYSWVLSSVSAFWLGLWLGLWLLRALWNLNIH
jgi:hypothetical protein